MTSFDTSRREFLRHTALFAGAAAAPGLLAARARAQSIRLGGPIFEKTEDPEAMAQALMQGGHVGKALDVRKGLREEQKAQLELKLKMAEATGSDALALDAAYRNALAANPNNPQAAIRWMSMPSERTRR